MKKLTLLVLLSPLFLFAQNTTTSTFSQPDNTSISPPVIWPGDCGSQNINPMNGNGTLGQIFNMTKCGLNFVQVSRKLGQRFTFSCCPSTNGAPQPATYTITGIPTCAVIEKAYVWSDCSGNGQPVNLTVVNPLLSSSTYPMTIIGTGIDKCWSAPGTQSYRADVTASITGNGNYILSGMPVSPTYPIVGSDTDGATLFIIYSDPTASFQGSIILHDGCIVVNGGSIPPQTITGINACANSTTASIFTIIADLQSGGCTLTMNNMAPYAWPGINDDWWNYIARPTTVANGQVTAPFLCNAGTCYNFLMMGLYYQTTTCTVCTSTGLTLTSTNNPATCSNCNGTATVSVTGGNAPYTYSWNTVPAQTTATATGLCAGTYTVYVTDASGCFSSNTPVTIVTSGGGLTLTSAQNNVLCNGGNNGTGSITVTGGTGPYTYLWSPSGGTNSSASNLSAGTYTVLVTDANGCTSTQTVTITQPTVLSATTMSTNVSCNAGNNGNGGVIATGGTGPYTYNWLPSGGTNATAPNLTAGTYTVTVTDANGCTTTQTITITQPAAINATTSSVTATCNSSNGSATVTASGGTGPYTYLWSSGGTGFTEINLAAGTYTVTITDANGCTSTATVTVANASGPTVQLTSQTNVSCFGGNDGSATVNVTGGTGPYTYLWSSGGTGSTENNLPDGTYTVTVTDANGCTSTTTVVITHPTAVLVTAISSLTQICLGQSVTLTANASGGTPGYTYVWTPGNLTSNPITLTPTTTTICGITITDANGCTATGTITVTVNQPPVVTMSVNDTDACGNLCVQFNTPVVGTYFWTFGNGNTSVLQNPSNCYMNPGNYNVSLLVTDLNGCTASALNNNWIHVYPVPTAAFGANPIAATVMNPTINFTDLSMGATTWAWTFGDILNGTSSQQNPSYTYTDTGYHQVMLITTNQYGCVDTAYLDITITDDFTFYAPNSFSPNGDGDNELWTPYGIGIDEADYKLLIYDRWGNLIWQTDQWGKGWDGKVQGGKSDEVVQEDVYVWKAFVKVKSTSQKKQYVGHITVVK